MANRYPIPSSLHNFPEANGLSTSMQQQHHQHQQQQQAQFQQQEQRSESPVSMTHPGPIQSQPMSGQLQNQPLYSNVQQNPLQKIQRQPHPSPSVPLLQVSASPQVPPHQSSQSVPPGQVGMTASAARNFPGTAPSNMNETHPTNLRSQGADPPPPSERPPIPSHQQVRRQPARPIPPAVAGITSAMGAASLTSNQKALLLSQQQHSMPDPVMNSYQGQPLSPVGMHTTNVSDPSALPRPNFSSGSVSTRVLSGDPAPTSLWTDVIAPAAFSPAQQSQSFQQNRVSTEIAACPPEIFVPASGSNIRLTSSAFPSSTSLAKKYALPLGAVIQPLAEPAAGESPIPVINFGTTGIVRCRRCRTYINFTCRFMDGGRRWKCSMCQFPNDCPGDYFSPLDETGRRRDAAQRPELHRGSIEFVAPAEYMVRPPMPPVYLFILEATPASMLSGALSAMIAGIKASLTGMPNEGRTRVGIITFDSAVHFYSLLSGDTAEPSVAVVADVDDMFIPGPENILVQLSECLPAFEKALDLIQASCKNRLAQMGSQSVVSSSSCLGAALQGAQRVMEHSGGKMLIFAASRPSVGPGHLRERGDGAALGTDRERAILRPDNSFYRQMAVEFSRYQLSCDLFLCPPPPGLFLDVATLAQLAKYTGGELFRAASFEAFRDHSRLVRSVHRSLTRRTGFEAVMRVRATKGIRCSQFHGRFFVRSTDLLAMPNVDSDKAYAVQFSFEDSIVPEGPFCVQVALLYTTTSGERRIRVHTVSAPITSSISDLFCRTDSPATANILLRIGAESVRDRLLDELKKTLTDKVLTALASYRTVCQQQYQGLSGVSTAGLLLLPDSMNLLPLFMHGLLKTPLLSRDSSGAFLYKVDDKAAVIHGVDVMNIAMSSAMLYPNVIRVFPPLSPSEWDREKHAVPPACPASISSLRMDTGVIIDDGQTVMLWLGSNIQVPFAVELMGQPPQTFAKGVDPRQVAYSLMDAKEHKGAVAQVKQAVNAILSSRCAGTAFHVVTAGGPLQSRVEALCVEDRGAAAPGYKEFMIEIQRQIMMKVSGRK